MATALAIWAFIQANWTTIAGIGIPAIYELIMRRKPTEKDWSIINLIKKIIDYILANKAQGGRLHK